MAIPIGTMDNLADKALQSDVEDEFSYDPEVPLIRDLSLVAEPGSTVAIVGPTGAGKTTLVNLIMRFYELDAGRITLDGVNIAQMSRRDLRKDIGMVLQDTWLFGGTIRDNIAYGNPSATEEQILAASRAAYVDRFVHSLLPSRVASPAAPDELSRARRCLAQGDWDDAYRSFREASGAAPLGGADASDFAHAARWSGRSDELVPLLEAAIDASRRENDGIGAARAVIDRKSLLSPREGRGRNPIALLRGRH